MLEGAGGCQLQAFIYRAHNASEFFVCERLCAYWVVQH